LSPEQVRGEVADHRSDIFSFGVVLFELATGTQLFKRSTATQTMAAILRDEVLELPMETPLAMTRIIAHALEKQPDKRFQSASDMAFALRNVNLSTTSAQLLIPSTCITRRRFVGSGAIAAGLIAAGGLGYQMGRKSAVSPPAAYRKVSTGMATRVYAARFAADGESVVYTVRKPGGLIDLAVVGLNDQSPRELNVAGVVNLVAVSASNELAVFLKGNVLARLPLFDTIPRKLIEDVVDADWMPDGESMAIIRREAAGQTRVEFPRGKVVAKFEDATTVRVSPDGERAVVAHFEGSAYGYLTVLQKNSKRTEIATFKAPTINALPFWSPGGHEVWISSLVGTERTIYAFGMRGNRRTITTLAGISELEAISRRGRVLIDVVDQRYGSMALGPGAVSEVDISLTDEYAFYSPMAKDGKTYAYTTFNGNLPVTYLRHLGEAHAVRLCNGTTCGPISPDLRWVPISRSRPRRGIFLVPTGAGTETEVTISGMTPVWVVGWRPDQSAIVAASLPEGPLTHLLIWNPSGQVHRVFAKGIFNSTECDPNGQLCITQPAGGAWRIYPTSGALSFDARGIERDEKPLAFTPDGKELFVTNPEMEENSTVWRVNWTTGKRTIWKRFNAPPGRQLHTWQLRIGPNADSSTSTKSIGLRFIR
jgi:hypothetical protein